MNSNSKAAFFDEIAEKWDGWENLTALERKLAAGLNELRVRTDETVVDIGCGTGNFTRALLAKLSPAGRVVAVDISPRMIELARRKVSDPRVFWHIADARRLPLKDGFYNRVFCYSVWPHFEDKKAVATEISRILAPGGSLHIWHLISRKQVNDIHRAAGEAVCHDMLPPAEETAELLTETGFRIISAHDDDYYLVTAVKPEH